MAKDLKRAAFSAVTWTALDTFGRQGIHFVISVILARLLAPEDFGLIAMLVVFIALADAFVDSGLSAALIQKPDVTPNDENTMFYLNIAVAFLAYGALWLAAPWIALFYRMESLTSLLRVLALGTVIRSFVIIQAALFQKQLNFRSNFVASMVAVPISGAIGIVMALKGCGVWSLVVQQLTGNVLAGASFWLMSKWRPRLIFSRHSFNTLTGYGSRQLAVGLVDTFFQNIYQMVIGRLFSAEALGYYSRASNLEKLPVNNLNMVLNRVAFPLFAAVQQDPERLRRFASRFLRMMALGVFPVLVGMVVTARPLVETLFSAKWLPCVPYFQLLCVLGLLFPLHLVNVNILRARGEMNRFLKLELLKKSLIAAAILITWRWGIIAMIWGQIVQSALNFFLNAYYGGRSIRYSWAQQLRDVLPYVGLTALMALAAGAAGLIPLSSAFALLLVQASAGAGVYLGLCYALHTPEFVEVMAWVASRTASARAKFGLASPLKT